MIKISNKSEWIEKNENENDKKNSNFIQIYRKKMPYLRSVLKKNDGAFSLFMFLIEHMDQKNSVICSMQVLCDFFEVSRQNMHEDNYLFVMPERGMRKRTLPENSVLGKPVNLPTLPFLFNSKPFRC